MGQLSPVVHQVATANAKVTAAKAKALTVLNNSQPASGNAEAEASDEEVTDLSEKLNLEIKRKYVKGKKLGEGTYAIVYKAHLASDPATFVAIKKVKTNTEFKDGMSMDTIREVKHLQELSHPNIITLHAVFSSKNQNVNLVLEFLPLGDLEMLIKDTEGVRYGLADIKAWMGMLGRAVWFCHENFVLHRDIKPNNLLIAADGEVKLADFGLARGFADPNLNMTHNVITRWYRPPELFYRAPHYSGAVDVWSVGCVFAELILRVPYLAGETDIAQLDKISLAIGTPTEENWPGVSKLPGWVPVPKDKIIRRHKQEFIGLFGTVGSEGVDLLMSTLMLDPRKRATAKQFLMHEWWRMDPAPTRKEHLPKKGGGEARIGEDLKRRGGELESGRADKVARKLDFSAMKKG